MNTSSRFMLNRPIILLAHALGIAQLVACLGVYSLGWHVGLPGIMHGADAVGTQQPFTWWLLLSFAYLFFKIAFTRKWTQTSINQHIGYLIAMTIACFFMTWFSNIFLYQVFMLNILQSFLREERKKTAWA